MATFDRVTSTTARRTSAQRPRRAGGDSNLVPSLYDTNRPPCFGDPTGDAIHNVGGDDGGVGSRGVDGGVGRGCKGGVPTCAPGGATTCATLCVDGGEMTCGCIAFGGGATTTGILLCTDPVGLFIDEQDARIATKTSDDCWYAVRETPHNSNS